MAVTYFKRYRMELRLEGPPPTEPPLPEWYSLVPWSPALIDAHAKAKYRSFCTEIDANIFPCLGDPQGCTGLMTDIARRRGFMGEATWLLQHHPPSAARPEYCGTVQGVRNRAGNGSIQNIGVAPQHRGKKLGSVLLVRAVRGFQTAGLRRATLEVTARNTSAIAMYERFGFRIVRTVYKAAEVAYA